VKKASTGVKVLAALLPLALGYGCAGTSTSSSQTGKGPDKADQALSEAKAARATADAALAQAQAANAKADQALAAANVLKTSGDSSQALAAARAAQQSADDAKRMAQQALDTSAKLDAKSDRMFQKAMQK